MTFYDILKRIPLFFFDAYITSHRFRPYEVYSRSESLVELQLI